MNRITENDILLLDSSKIVKVIWKKFNKVCIIEVGKDYPSAIVDLDRLSGVELTGDMLLNCGFEYELGLNYYYLGKLTISPNENYGKGRTYFNSWAIKEDVPKTIHQLQHLTYALTNQELIYKP